jgi:hypothetical protein
LRSFQIIAASLRPNAVSYVALPTDAPLDVYGRAEAAVVAGAPPYLREVWRDRHWRLFRVRDVWPFVDRGTLVSATPSVVTVDVPGAGDVTVRVRWSRWLTASGGACVAPAADGWTTLRAPSSGRYTISSGLRGRACR